MSKEKHFGELLREWRLQNLMTIASVSELTGVSISALAGYERGDYSPTPLTRARIYKAIPELRQVSE